MNMKNYLILIPCLFIISCSNHNSDSLSVDLNTIYDQPNRGFLILYPISEMEDSSRSKIIFPNMSEVSDTVFAQIYFTGNNRSGIENGILVLVGDHSSESPLFWVDYNNDLDFSDADEPLLFSEEFIDISIPNIDKPELAHTIRFYKPDFTKKAEAKNMIEQFITKGEPYADFYFDQRRNIRVGDFVYEQDSLRVGLLDQNVNGAYNDLGADRIVIGEYGGNIKGSDEATGAVVIDSTTYFHGTSHGFEVIDIADDGTSISIRPTLTNHIESRITEGESIPDFSFDLFSGGETSVYNLLDGQKFLYLNFWANWCAGCHQEIDDLKRIHSDYADKVTLVSLNYNEDTEKIESFLDKYEVNWLNGYSTSEINEELFIQGLPRNILVDPSGEIIEMNIHPSRLLNRIDQL